MSEKTCLDCVFYQPAKPEYSMGTCDYPVPQWIKIHSRTSKRDVYVLPDKCCP